MKKINKKKLAFKVLASVILLIFVLGTLLMFMV